MTLRFIDSLNAQQTQQLHQLYQQVWWAVGRTLADVQRMLAGSSLIFALVDTDQQLLGFARVLTDGAYKFIFDVIVTEQHQGTGLGKQLMDRIINDPRLSSVKHLELYCLPELVPFYERWGFSAEVGAIQLMRK